MSGSTSSVLTISGIEFADTGSYAVVVSNDEGSVTSKNALLTIGAPLLVQMTGLGTLLPNYSNAVLGVGQSYSMTATPGTGLAFTNWTGGTSLPLAVLTNGRTVQFSMTSNLTLQANFVDTNRPTVSITNPAAAIRASNAVMDVSGWARDKDRVTNVWVSVGAADFLPARTLNQWTNWVLAGQTLAPGTNVLRAYAADTTGNLSQIATSRVIYVLSDRLTLEINPSGGGTVSGVVNGQWLEINRALIATAKSNGTGGFVFSSWTRTTNGTDWVTSNVPALNFTMQSNLVLRATFLDVRKPTFTIKSPTANQQCSNAQFTIKGTASDNMQVWKVQYNLNNGGWQPADGTTNWTKEVPLVKGTNTVQVFAVDTTGNRSATNKVTFVFNQFLALKATYNGLFYPTNAVGATNSGGITLTVDGTVRGGFSGKLSLAGTDLPLTGAFGQDLLAQVSVLRPNQPPLALTLQLNPIWTNSDSQLIRSNAVTGTVADGTNWFSDLFALSAFSGKTNAYAGTYTMLIVGNESPGISPPGDGAGMVTGGGGGTVSVKGALADKTPFTCSTTVSADGLWPMFVSLYGGRGLFIGWMACDSNQLDAGWLKPALVPKDPINTNGFTVWPPVLLSKYTPPAAGRSAVNWTNGWVVLEFGDLPQPLTNYVVVSNGTVRVVSGTISNLTFAFTSKDGTFSGSFKHPATNVPVKFSGVLVPAASGNDAFGGGWFVGPSQGGRVRFESAEGDRNPFAGTYSANYTNSATSSLTIAVGFFGDASVVLNDSNYGILSGNGSVSTNGELTATATQTNTAISVYVSGQFSNQGGAVTVTGSVSGDVQVPSWTGDQIAPLGINAFVGNWTGSYSGGGSGTWTATIAADGTFKGKAPGSSCGGVTLTGTVSPAGLGNLQGSGSGVSCPGHRVAWQGAFFLNGSQPVADGTWISNYGDSGQWIGYRQASGM